MGYGCTSQRDALWASPTHPAVGRAFFVTCGRVLFHRLYAIPRGRLKGVPP